MQIEERLSTYLGWAERWKAIVLIDEADVFLRKRFMHDSTFSGESTVASKEGTTLIIPLRVLTLILLLFPVFLKALEYYSGLMFLTTNRVSSFDRAAIDRVTLMIKFPSLTESSKETILKNCLTKLGDSKRIAGLTPDARKRIDEALKSMEYEWSGREIVQGTLLSNKKGIK